MEAAAHESRAYDTKTLKADIKSYIMSELKTDQDKLELGPLDEKSKEGRGFRNKIIARYLVPAERCDLYKQNPEK